LGRADGSGSRRRRDVPLIEHAPRAMALAQAYLEAYAAELRALATELGPLDDAPSAVSLVVYYNETETGQAC
jgi:hypothetical protein